MNDETFKQKQQARIIAHWKATKAMSKPVTVHTDTNLAYLQRQAEARAAALWDPDEAADFDGNGPRQIADALDSAIHDTTDAWLQPEARIYYIEGYAAYLKTRHWQRLRQHMLKRAGGFCMQCHHRAHLLEVHHLTYRNLGNERESDLRVLCRQCHHAEHDNAQC